MKRERGIVYTFYSFKGGVGRSMALANVAALLAKKGKKVLAIDWDLEAPGLEKYFSDSTPSISRSRKETPGVLDLIRAFLKEEPLDWRKCLLLAHPFNEGLPVSILSAGRDSDNYVPFLQTINWEHLFNEEGFGAYLERLREEWVAEFDYILVDSRTGITDVGGICTIHLPDILVLLFTANEQSLAGVIDVMHRARARYQTLPFDRATLLGVPVPSRFENVTEYRLANEWKGIFAQRLIDIYKDWLPDRTTAGEILEKLFIPNVPFWSFGEGLPVVKEGTSDPRSLGFAYDLLARLLDSRLQWKESLQGDVALSDERGPELINQDADRVYESLSEWRQESAKRIFLRLVHVAQQPEAEDAKRRAPLKEFDIAEKGVIHELVDYRLLYVSPDSLTKESVVEIAQEGLLRNWRRLRQWIEENRDILLWQQDLNARMLEWENSDHDKSQLLTGTALVRAERIMQARGEELKDSEKEFIVRSLDERERRKRVESRTRLFTYIPYVLLAAVIGIAGAFYAYFRQQQAQQQEQQAQQRAQLDQLLKTQEAKQNELQDQLNKLSEQLREAQARNDQLLQQLLPKQRNGKTLN